MKAHEETLLSRSPNPAMYDPADPHDHRHPDQPILEIFEIAIEGGNIHEHARQIRRILTHTPGMDRVESHVREGFVRITYDARITTQATIHETLLAEGYEPARRAG